MLKSIGKIYPKTKSNSLLLYIPSDIVTDSQFPLLKLKGSEVDIEIIDNTLVIKKKE